MSNIQILIRWILPGHEGPPGRRRIRSFVRATVAGWRHAGFRGTAIRLIYAPVYIRDKNLGDSNKFPACNCIRIDSGPRKNALGVMGLDMNRNGDCDRSIASYYSHFAAK